MVQRYFYPRPPRGGRLGPWLPQTGDRLFLSTPSARRATSSLTTTRPPPPNFYPRPPRGGRPRGISHPLSHKRISIHALREEGDGSTGGVFSFYKISIHALREDGDAGAVLPRAFQADFYPRPPRGGRQQKQRQNLYFQTNYTTFCTNLEEP